MSRKRPFSYYDTQSQFTDYEGSSQGVVVAVKGKGGTKGNGLLGKKRMQANRRALSRLSRRPLGLSAEHKKISHKLNGTITAFGGGIPLDINLMFNPTTLAQNQGVGQGDRIGNSIRIIKSVIKGVIYPLPYGGATNPLPTPMEVRAVYLTNRQVPQANPTNGNFFQGGDTTYGLTGTMFDMVGDINRDINTVYKDKVYKIGTSIGGPAAQGGQATYAFHANNDFKYNVKFTQDITKFMPKVVHFNDNSTTPQEKYVWLRLFAADADNSASAATEPVSIIYEIVHTFIDV